MHAFTVHPQKAATDPPRRPWSWRRWAAILLLLLLLGGLVWAIRPDPHLARAQELQKELFSPEARNLAPEERKARFAEFREQVKHLSADQKRELSAPMREKRKAEMERYFALSPKEKTKYLDERIDRSEKMRKEREQKTAQGNRSGQSGAGGFGGGPGGNKAGASGGGSPLSAEDIEKRRKQFLEQTTPEERAMMDQFRKDMHDRRLQRGLPVRF